MIIKQEKKGNVTIYYVDTDFDNNKMEKILNTILKRDQIKTIISENADVFTKEGKLLIRFRKNKLTKQYIDEFYDNVHKFALNTSSNRGNATGSKTRNNATNPRVMSNILGYFDKLSPNHKSTFKSKGIPLPKITVRETRFNVNHPDKFKKLIPLIK